MPSAAPYELNSQMEIARMLRIAYASVPERLGACDALIEWSDLKDVPAWLSERLDSFLAGEPSLPVTSEPIRFYSLRRAAMLLETNAPKAKELLGNPDAIFIAGARSYPVWNHANLTTAWRIITDAKLEGNQSFTPRVYRRKPKLRRLFKVRRLTRVSRVRFCKPEHRDANPADVMANRQLTWSEQRAREKLASKS